MDFQETLNLEGTIPEAAPVSVTLVYELPHNRGCMSV